MHHPTGPLVISCLGQFQALVDGVAARFATDQGRALLAYLAIEAGRPHARTYLAYLLWPDQSEPQALNNLRQTLIRLRQALGMGDDLASVLQISPKTLQFNASGALLDVRLFQQLLVQCKTHVHRSLEQCAECMQALEQAAELYQGEFLQSLMLRHSQPFNEWATYVREELHHQVTSVLSTLALFHEERANYEQARHYTARLLALEPWQEEAHCQMMRVLAKNGNRPAALLQYESCRRILREELGIAPSAETTQLYEQIKAGTLERVSHSGDSVLAAARRDGNLPAISRLYGRQAELAKLEQWLLQERCQLISVVGMGGIGKTAIAAATAAASARHFDLILWRSLLNAPPLDEILRDWFEILSVDGLSNLPDSLDARLALLLQHLRNRRCLLVLDNLESIFRPGQAGQVQPEFEGYSQLLRQVAEAQHRSCLILTSREQVQAIARWEEDLPWVRTLHLEGLDAAAAQTLLVERELSPQSEHTAILVNRYSGNPLALKLVAETIQELFAGDAAAFLAAEVIIFDDIRAVLDQQFSRLSPLEQEILVWLAIEREPLSLESLRDNLAPVQPTPEIVRYAPCSDARLSNAPAATRQTGRSIRRDYGRIRDLPRPMWSWNIWLTVWCRRCARRLSRKDRTGCTRLL
jgi:DNA-binding SARP family transcriptional activator